MPDRPPEQVAEHGIYNHPVMGQYFTPSNFRVMAADEKRKELNRQVSGGGGLEWWPPEETGPPGYPHPSGGGVYISEIFDDELRSNPEALKDAVYRDALHGLPGKDKYWKILREDFRNNFDPNILEFLKKRHAKQGEHDSFDSWMDRSMTDAFLRGAFGDEGQLGASFRGEPEYEWKGQRGKSEQWYSPKQREILDKMRKYLGYEG